MAVAETARLIVDLSLKGNFARQLGKTGSALNKFDARLDATESRAFRAGQQIGTGIKRAAGIGAIGIGILAYQVGRGLESLVELEKQTAQTNAVIKSTKGVAGITAEEVGRLAESFESMNATVGDEFIRGAQNMLLTFTGIRRDAFKPTLQAVLDMNTALGKGPEGLTSTVIQVGKALNDPATGLTALRRVGVQFSVAQIKRIKTLQKEGKLYEAQKIILAELNKEFGGSFLAQGGTTAGKVAKFHDAIEDLQRTLAAGMLPVVSNIADALSDLFKDPAIQKGVADTGKSLAGIFTPANIQSGVRALGSVVTLLADLGPLLTEAAGGVRAIVGAAASAFKSLPPELQKLAIAGLVINKLTGGLLTNVVGGVIGSALKTIVAGNVTVIGKSVIGPGGIPDPRGGTAVAGGSGVSKLFAAGIAGIIVASAIPFGEAFKRILPKEFQGPGGRGESESQRRILEAQAKVLAGIRAFEAQRRQEGSQNPDRTEARETARVQAIAAAFVQAANREGERGRGKAPGASTQTQNEIKELAGKLAQTNTNTGSVIPGSIENLRAGSIASISKLDSTTAAKGDANRTATLVGSTVISGTTRASSLTNAAIVAGATRATGAAIVGAIWAARPIVNVTNVTKSTTIQNRYGPGNGSYGTSSGE